MRIVFVTHHYCEPNSGAGGSIYHLSEECRQLGHEVAVISYDDLPKGLPAKARQPLFPWFAAIRLIQIQRGGPVDVVEANCGDAWVWRTVINGEKAPILVNRSHGLEHRASEFWREEAAEGRALLSWRYDLYHGGWRLWEVAHSCRQADVTCFLNSLDLDYAIGKLNVTPNRAALVCHGLRQDLLGLPICVTQQAEDPMKIAVIGTFTARKGADYAVPALSEILLERPAVELSILGTNEAVETTKAHFAPQFHDRIAILPKFSNRDLPSLLRGHQILLYPSIREGFGKACLEGMACGLAPVVTDLGLDHIVCDGANALIIPPRDTQAIVAALRQLLDNPALLARLRAAAHATAQAYSWNSIAQQQIELYQKHLEKRRRKAVG